MSYFGHYPVRPRPVMDGCPVCGARVDDVESVAEKVYEKHQPRVPTGEERMSHTAYPCSHSVGVSRDDEGRMLLSLPAAPAPPGNPDATGLRDFLLARLAEDEATARAALALAQTPWRAATGRQVNAGAGELVTPEDEYAEANEPADAVAEHIARHDPDRVLAEVAVKRSIVELHSDGSYDFAHGEVPEWADDCATLRALASAYSDHPDFDLGWAP